AQARDRRRSRPVHRVARTGTGLQGRLAQDPGAAGARGGDVARRLRPARLPRRGAAARRAAARHARKRHRRVDPSSSGVTRRVVAAFVGLMLVMVLSSLDGTIVATALPTITRDIGGFSRVTWVITAYL